MIVKDGFFGDQWRLDGWIISGGVRYAVLMECEGVFMENSLRPPMVKHVRESELFRYRAIR